MENFSTIIDVKFRHAELLLKSGIEAILWCDCDHIFLGKIGNFNSNSAAYLTPHYSNNFADEGVVGFYNCGFVYIKTIDFLVEWYRLFAKRDQLNLYFEQKALELAAKKFECSILPINYNVGWWKFMNSRFEGNGSYLDLYRGLLYGLPIVNFHFHFFGENNHSFSASEFRQIVFAILNSRGATPDLELLQFIKELEWKTL
jgi:hypothetical protein